MHIFKKILVVLLIIFIVIQFIQPDRNKSVQVVPADVTKDVSVPENVQIILQAACYDCHSNNTNYPWYNYVQPVGWILANHIKHGKRDLNFSDFGSYPIRKQQSKLKAIADQIKDGEMPLYSYTIIHKKARLSKEQKVLITDWAQKAQDSLDKINP
ncbi:MAG: heme-binding domain-containing protein [Bacteroidota bacterium]|nr:heme-binding domain-containing protein [Bacteroidota bacterium]